MTRVFCLLVATCLLFASGCDTFQKPAPVIVAAPPSLEDLPLVAHPEYENWSKFPVGTRVVRKDTLASSEGDVTLHTTLKLTAKSEANITLETQTAIERSGNRQDSDLNSVEYPAQFRLPKGMTIEQFQLPALKAQKMDVEMITVAGKVYTAEVYRFEDQSEAGPVDVTLWRSSEIPGRQAKKEIIDRKGLMLTSSNLIEFHTP